ncbi:MAG: N-acetylglucosamine-6-phosphate deacetylase, partial [Ornithinibacter sp.]
LQGGPALVTHLFNGMPPLHHRSGGPVAAALTAAARGEAIVELITDGVHVAPEVVRMVFETIGPDAVALVSDSMAATGLGDGTYRLGSLDVEVTDGIARTTDTGAIAGSTSTLADCVRWAVEVAGVDPADAERSASITPARALGLG